MSIKLETLISLYKVKKTDEEKEKLILDHINNHYVPYEEKAAVANKIVDASYWRTVVGSDGKEVKELHVDSIVKHMLVCMSLIDLYTTVECDNKNGKMLDNYNKLNEIGLLDFIIQNINPRELKEFRMILQLTCDDLIANEFENHAYITKQVNRFGELIGTALAPVISQLDINKIENVIKQIQ